MKTRIHRVATVILLMAAPVFAAEPAKPARLPERTSQYNVGARPGRERGADGKIKRFELNRGETPLFDGGGREIGRVKNDVTVLLNIGAGKRMDLDGKPGSEEYVWAWKTPAGSGWIERAALKDPPPFQIDLARNPKPPGESKTPLTIDAAAGTKLLTGLRHTNTEGVIPREGNRGEHYTGRNPGPRDYVYLLFAVPNVQRGGVARDSLPDGSQFLQALDERGQPITATMTMYRDDQFSDPTSVTFLYGRAKDGEAYGWLARANVGQR